MRHYPWKDVTGVSVHCRHALTKSCLLLAVSSFGVLFPEFCAEASEREVVTVVLDHFAARTDAYFYDRNSRLAVRRRTIAMGNAAPRYSEINKGEGHCSIPESLYAALVSGNAKDSPAQDLVSPSESWWVMTPAEESEIRPTFPPPPGKESVPVKTVVGLTRPVFSDDGLRALMFLQFLWSIHGAEARYVLAKRNGAWAVVCSQLVFYP
jgi:hypothetical protein